MQRFLLATFLFLSAGLSAQVDSFMVEGKMFKLEIPQDWVLEEKVDGVQGDSTWNFILKYAVDDPKLNARIGVKVERRLPPGKGASTFNRRSSVDFGYTRMGPGEIAYASIQYPKGTKCKSCLYEYTDINVYYLNEKLNLTLVSFTKGKKDVIDSLRKTFFRFRDNLFRRNTEVIKSFRTLYVPNERWVSDSVLLLGKFYRFSRDSTWKKTTVVSGDITGNGQMLALTCKLPDGTQAIIYIDVISAEKKAKKPIKTSDLRPSTSTVVRPYKREYGILDTTINVQRTNWGYESSPSAFIHAHHANYSPDRLYQFLTPAGAPEWEDHEIAFSIRINCTSEDYLLRQHYTFMLEDFVRHFLEENRFFCPFYPQVFTYTEVPLPSAPASVPAVPAKKTTSE